MGTVQYCQYYTRVISVYHDVWELVSDISQPSRHDRTSQTSYSKIVDVWVQKTHGWLGGDKTLIYVIIPPRWCCQTDGDEEFRLRAVMRGVNRKNLTQTESWLSMIENDWVATQMSSKLSRFSRTSRVIASRRRQSCESERTGSVNNPSLR